VAARTTNSAGLSGTSVVAIPDQALRERSRPAYAAVKRTIDTVGALVLLLLLSPLFLVVALAVVIDSGWPIFYRGERIGRNAHTFQVLKFRSMRVNADSSVHAEYLRELLNGHAQANGGIYKIPRDPRITRIGGFLRRTSIDEFPQLLNVLRGQMSLVGPRPEVPYALPDYEPWMFRRFEVQPGMTGLWQVSGRAQLSVRDMLRLDVEYAERCDIALDFDILARTIPAVLRGTGAA
jgi:lipopolysaccharide/colanic/teichoic acid biosynthesis glycosyltransferase